MFSVLSLVLYYGTPIVQVHSLESSNTKFYVIPNPLHTYDEERFHRI